MQRLFVKTLSVSLKQSQAIASIGFRSLPIGRFRFHSQALAADTDTKTDTETDTKAKTDTDTDVEIGFGSLTLPDTVSFCFLADTEGAVFVKLSQQYKISYLAAHRTTGRSGAGQKSNSKNE